MAYSPFHADWHDASEAQDTPITAAALEYIESGITAAAATADAAIAKAIVDAKGDLIAATAADTVARLAVGSNDQLLVADSAQSAGLKYAKLTDAMVDAAASIALSKLAQSALTTYVPTWTGSSVNPAIGNGTLSGRYVQIGKLVKVSIAMSAGSTTTFGTGDWRFSLPVAGHATIESNGEARYFDSSGSAFYRGLARWNGTILQARTNASPTVLVDATNPFTWATSDSLYIDLWYEAA